jgi:Mg2+ and Co2+ transporter CorA
LTLITSFYWMNIELPYSDNNIFIYLILLLTLTLFYIIYLYLRKKWRL